MAKSCMLALLTLGAFLSTSCSDKTYQQLFGTQFPPAFGEATGDLTAGDLVAVASHPNNNQAYVRATLPQGTKLVDANGNEVDTSSVTLQIAGFDSSPASQAAFGPVSQVLPDGRTRNFQRVLTFELNLQSTQAGSSKQGQVTYFDSFSNFDIDFALDNFSQVERQAAFDAGRTKDIIRCEYYTQVSVDSPKVLLEKHDYAKEDKRSFIQDSNFFTEFSQAEFVWSDVNEPATLKFFLEIEDVSSIVCSGIVEESTTEPEPSGSGSGSGTGGGSTGTTGG